jgi:hypothetical protein
LNSNINVDDYVEVLEERHSIPVSIRPAAVVEHRFEERSGRAVNAMDPDTRRIHARLEEWAVQVRRSAGACGYPPESVYVKWALLGVRTETGHESELSPRAANVEAAVLRLCAIDQGVIRRYYLAWRQTGIWKGLAGINNDDKFRAILSRARFRVDGYLSAIEQT